jgi:hypothetical protein
MAKKKKARDSAAIAQKARITKARKVLKNWADSQVQLELLSPGVGIRVRGTIRQLGDLRNEFVFVSASREISSTIFLGMWTGIAVEHKEPFGTRVYLKPDVAGDHGVTLQEAGGGPKKPELASVLKQLGLWAKLQTRLISSFEFPFASSFWTGTIKEYSPGVFSLTSRDANQAHLIDTALCGGMGIDRVKGRTIVTLSSWTGSFYVTISDAQSNIEAAYKRFAMRSTAVH